MLARNEKKIFFAWFLVRQTNYKLIKKTIEIQYRLTLQAKREREMA
jgi:hypothetical protein